MARREIHTVYEHGRWENRRAGESEPLTTSATKQEAVDEGRKLALRSQAEHVVYDPDGMPDTREGHDDGPARAIERGGARDAMRRRVRMRIPAPREARRGASAYSKPRRSQLAATVRRTIAAQRASTGCSVASVTGLAT